MENWNIPIHQSLTQPILVGGAPREFTILNCTFTLVLVFGLNSILALPIGMALHAVAVRIAKRDPYFLDTFRRHLSYKDFYEA